MTELKPQEVKQVEETLDELPGATDYLKWREVDQPEGTAPEVRIRPTSENEHMNNRELAALRTAGFVVTTIDIDNGEVWVRGV